MRDWELGAIANGDESRGLKGVGGCEITGIGHHVCGGASVKIPVTGTGRNSGDTG